jgi:hypothetical protein
LRIIGPESLRVKISVSQTHTAISPIARDST